MDNVVDLLAGEGLLEDEAALNVRAALESGQSLTEALRTANDPGAEERVLRFFAARFGLNYVDLEHLNPPRELLTRFPAGLLLKHKLLPLSEADGVVEVATCDPFDGGPLDRLRIATGLEVRPALAPCADIERVAK